MASIKFIDTAGLTPTSIQMSQNEVIINRIDSVMYYKDLYGNVHSLGLGSIEIVEPYDDSEVLKHSDANSSVTESNKLATMSDLGSGGGGDMYKSVYDTTDNGIVDNSEKVNGFTVDTNVPFGALFTDTVYDDTAIQQEVTLNTAKVTNVDHPLVETAVPTGALFTDTIYNDTAIQAEVDLNTAKVTNVNHPLVETAVPIGAVFTDTVYDSTAIQAEVDLNTAKETNIVHPLVETAVPVGAVFTDTIYDDTPVTSHISNTSNPHTVTQTQVGLSNVDNTSDTTKPVSTPQQTEIDTKVEWRGKWVNATYPKNSLVRDGSWTMVSNQETSERAGLVDIGSPYYYYTGTLSDFINSAKQIIFGTRYTIANVAQINGYRIHTVTGNTYHLYMVQDPLGTPILTSSHQFTAETTGWIDLTSISRIVGNGITFDLLVEVQEPASTPVVSTFNYNYTTPNNNAVPLPGDIVHANKSTSDLRIHKIDDDGNNNAGFLGGLTVGDIIELDTIRWTIQAVTIETDYVSYEVSPATQYGTRGVVGVTFETVTATDITIGREVGYNTALPSSGLFIADGKYADITPDDNQYGVDVLLQEVSKSEHWDVVATSTAVASGADGGSDIVIVDDLITQDSSKALSANQGYVLDNAKVANARVLTDVPAGAVFTDTLYDDTAIQAEVDLNTAKVTNVVHPLVQTAVPVGAVFTDTLYDDTAIQSEVDLNTAKVTNVAHPLVETAVPVGAVFTDTTYTIGDGGLTAVNFTLDMDIELATAYSHSQAAHASTNAEQNVQSDWNETNASDDAFILNKPDTYLNIQDFGAVGDNTTDNTVAIQNALDDAILLGKVVLIPSGLFKFTNLSITGALNMVGLGVTSVLVKTSSAGNGIELIGSPSYHAKLSNFAMIVNTVQTSGSLIYVYQMHQSGFDNIFLDGGYYGLYLYKSSQCALRWIRSQNNEVNGLLLADCLDMYLDNSRFDNNTETGVHINTASGVYATNITAYGNKHGYYIEDTISSSTVADANGYHFYTNCIADSSHNHNWDITDLTRSYFTACWGATQTADGVFFGFKFANCQNVTMTGGTALNNRASGIDIDSNCSYIGITGMNINGNGIGALGGYGIANSGTYINITSNIFTSNATGNINGGDSTSTVALNMPDDTTIVGTNTNYAIKYPDGSAICVLVGVELSYASATDYDYIWTLPITMRDTNYAVNGTWVDTIPNPQNNPALATEVLLRELNKTTTFVKLNAWTNGLWTDHIDELVKVSATLHGRWR